MLKATMISEAGIWKERVSYGARVRCHSVDWPFMKSHSHGWQVMLAVE